MDSIERYVVPATMNEAAELLRAGNVTVLAGGTDLMPQTRAGRVRAQPVLMNIRRLAELRGVSLADGWLRIGALTSVSDLLASDAVRENAPLIAEAADHFASEQVRNAGTVGGNVCNASPAGDLLVPLLVLDAEAELASAGEGGIVTRRVPLRGFFLGPGRTQRAANELLAAVRLRVSPSGFVGRFFKFGTRPALDISAISIGFGAVRGGGTLSGVRVAFGAVAPTPVRAPATEASLEGRRLDSKTIAAAAAAARDEVQPISDVRASAWYRRELIHNITMRMLNDVAQG